MKSYSSPALTSHVRGQKENKALLLCLRREGKAFAFFYRVYNCGTDYLSEGNDGLKLLPL